MLKLAILPNWCYLQSYFFNFDFKIPKTSDRINNIGLTIIIKNIPSPIKNVFILNSKDIFQEIMFNIKPIGNNKIANMHSLVKFNFQIIYSLFIN